MAQLWGHRSLLQVWCKVQVERWLGREARTPTSIGLRHAGPPTLYLCTLDLCTPHPCTSAPLWKTFAPLALLGTCVSLAWLKLHVLVLAGAWLPVNLRDAFWSHLAGKPSLPHRPKQSLCVPTTGPTGPPSLSRGCFFHHMDLAVDELREKRGCPIPSPPDP